MSRKEVNPMGLFDWLFGGTELPDIKDYLDAKQAEAAEWHAQQSAELEARQQRIEDLNDALLQLKIDAERR